MYILTHEVKLIEEEKFYTTEEVMALLRTKEPFDFESSRPTVSISLYHWPPVKEFVQKNNLTGEDIYLPYETIHKTVPFKCLPEHLGQPLPELVMKESVEDFFTRLEPSSRTVGTKLQYNGQILAYYITGWKLVL